ncbi:MAG: TerC family protein [Rhodospirillales bacterium]|nr:TerC family protein [Rhodospirillales bacterium]MCB9973128.1 TerC family protein [Rhodospirillales bacterium]
MLETALAFLSDPHIWAAFTTLLVLEIVLGIDNLILISILADKLPKNQQPLARKLGLLVALISRLMLLSLAFWIAHLETALFSIFGTEISWRDILLIFGGLFLLAKGTYEIHEKLEGEGHESEARRAGSHLFALVILQIGFMDVIFSFDSVMTAIGIAEDLPVMIAAIVISLIVMILAVDMVSDFINRHPTVKILALSYMLLIGMMLIAEGFHVHVPRGYLYFAMAFSFMVEVLNMLVRRAKHKPIPPPLKEDH